RPTSPAAPAPARAHAPPVLAAAAAPAPPRRRPRRRRPARAHRGARRSRGALPPSHLPRRRPPPPSRPRSDRFPTGGAPCPRRDAVPRLHGCVSCDHLLRPCGFEPRQQLVLDELVLGFGELSGIECDLRFDEQPPDARRVGELLLGVVGETLGKPDRRTQRRQRQQQDAGQESHRSSTKWWGGSGPVYLNRTTPSRSRAIAFIVESNFSIASRSTRNAARRIS